MKLERRKGMLNSKDFKPNDLVVDYLFEYKEAVKNYENFEEIAKIVIEQTKTNPKFVLSCVHYNTKTQKFFIDSTKFDQYSITVYNSFGAFFTNGSQATKETFTNVESFGGFLSYKLSEISWSPEINNELVEVNNELVLRFNLVSYHRVANGGYGKKLNREDLKKHFNNSAGRGTSQYFFAPYTLTPVKIKYSLNLSGVVLDTYICAKIQELCDLKKELKLPPTNLDLKNIYIEKLYDLFLISGIKMSELGDDVKGRLKSTFKGKQFELLRLVKLHYSLREELFSTFWVYEKFLNNEESHLLPDKRWLSVFERYNELDLFTYLRYIYKALTGFGLKKFKAVNVLVGE